MVLCGASRRATASQNVLFQNLDLRATEHQVTTAFVACMLCCELEGILESI